MNGIGRISVREIATRLSIGRMAVYALLKRGVIPSIRLGRRFLVTLKAYEEWERGCGREDAHLALHRPH